MNITNKNIDSLIFAEYNPRQLGKDEYKHLKDSIDRFGLVDPVIINKNKERKNIIVGGHQRVRVAKDMGIDKIPCVEVNLSYDKERELNIRLNKNTGQWDYDILADMFDMNELIDWGFTEDELVGYAADEEKEGLIDDDEIPEAVEPVCKLGDIWELGKHRLLCGDSTKKENIELLLDGSKADMVFTDPPYDGELGYGGFKRDKALNARKQKAMDSVRHLYKFNPESTFKVIEQVKNDKISMFLFCNKKLVPVYLNYALETERIFNILQWHKPNYIPMNNNSYFPDTEYIIKINDSGATFNTGIPKEEVYYGKYWIIDKNNNINHPTVKPIKIITDCIQISSNKNNTILDPFLGSGSTLIACEKTNRVCYGMELDEHYCDVIINRWEQYTGKKAKLLNG